MHIVYYTFPLYPRRTCRPSSREMNDLICSESFHLNARNETLSAENFLLLIKNLNFASKSKFEIHYLFSLGPIPRYDVTTPTLWH